jgi:D-3-phosphoglycerate dehydrogenase
MTGKRVIITEPIHEHGLDILRRETQAVYLPELPGRTLADEIKEADAIAVRVVKIGADLLARADNLRIIAKHGVGYDNIDVEAATARGVVVVNSPVNAESVAEHNLGLMLSLSKQIATTERALRENRLGPREEYMGVEMKGKTLGLIGLGRIGSELARKCQLAFDMPVMVYDPYVPAEKVEQMGYTRIESMDEVLREADFVVICVPLTRETADLIGTRELGLMKPGAFLVNSSRGGIVDETALHDHLVKGGIAGAGLDVFTQEPPPADHPLLGLDNFIATPHIAGVTAEAMRMMAITVAEEIVRVLCGERPKHPVNPQVLA